ncbi:MAG: glycosyltransferase, partial [Lachnospiraceae bacterium]|nr:glycosyltransferase [Lachnospiraceae bacterium]
MEDIKFTFLMPCWNGEKYIEQAIDSVLSQTYNNWELVFIDNGSSDNTGKIIDEYANHDKRIIPVHITHLDTVSKSRNAGIPFITGDYTQLLDSDDYISHDMLEKYYKIIKSTNCDICLSDVITFNDKNETKLMFKGFLGDYSQIISGKKAFFYSIDWRIHAWLCAKSFIIKNIKFDTTNFVGDEYSTRLMLAQAADIAFTDAIYFYRNNPLSTGKHPKNQLKKMT